MYLNRLVLQIRNGAVAYDGEAHDFVRTQVWVEDEVSEADEARWAEQVEELDGFEYGDEPF